MKPDRIFWGAGALMLLLSVGLGVQVNSLSGRLAEKDRTIRLLGAELRKISAGAGPLQASLTSEGSRLFSLKIKLRSKNKEIENMKDDLVQKEGELDTARDEASGKSAAIRTLRGELMETGMELTRLVNEKKELEKRLASRGKSDADRLKEKEKEIVSLKKDNDALKESLDGLKESVQTLRKQKKKLAAPRLPKEVREKIKEFGAR